ncbi:hypothetical protein Acid345_3178 [Candidatus Koribacter versatilis Ellin345]|uniref:Uncharacterized protein n=1 Tax=Koribacter versatilis (strain Ellin345) TaxID=204669 RepID=Q1ILS1_KORVE|nr:hypothetical protein [Candidatus Koribacter versatilis]ABF42179.1 hypothetical protein Acid345_3178 [Candidatus Koribacter versatilis Ellin345]
MANERYERKKTLRALRCILARIHSGWFDVRCRRIRGSRAEAVEASAFVRRLHQLEEWYRGGYNAVLAIYKAEEEAAKRG